MIRKANNYGEVRQYLANLTPFRHRSCSAEILPPGQMPRTGLLDSEERSLLGGLDGRYATYVVYSYGTPIAYAQGDYWEGRYVVRQRFSTTTSKQQHYVRAAWARGEA